MEENRKLPGPWSWAHVAAGILVGVSALAGNEIAGDRGLLIGLLAGIAVAIGVLLFWVSRPCKRRR